MQNQLIEDIAFDLNIESYPGESENLYQARVLYSALSLWMKYILLDHMISEDESEIKSKNYHYRRTSEILCEYIKLYPSFKAWTLPKSNIDIIHEIRSRLMAAGEILEVDFSGNISLKKPESIPINYSTSRLIGLNSEGLSFKYAGLTMLMPDENERKIEHPISNSLHIIKGYLDSHVYGNNIMQGNEYELYNAYNSHYNKDWISNGKITRKINLIRRNKGQQNYWDYSLILMHNEQLYEYVINEELVKQGFHTVVILGIHKFYNKSIKANFIEKGTIVELNLKIILPRYEMGVLETFSWPKNHVTDKWSYIVPKEIWSEITEMLIILGYEMERI